MRVALISARGDLGAVPVLYSKPQQYADFLGQEIVFYCKGPLLVVMPNGFGFFENGEAGGGREAEAVRRCPPADSSEGDALAPPPRTRCGRSRSSAGSSSRRAAAEKGSSKNGDRVQIVAGVVLLSGLAFAARMLLVGGGRRIPILRRAGLPRGGGRGRRRGRLRRRRRRKSDAESFRGIVLPEQPKAPNFRLDDQNGREVTLARSAGSGC